MVDNNTYHEVVFTDLTHDARGVCRIDGYPVFVKDALKGERALIKLIKRNANFGIGRLVDIREASPYRKIPICEHYEVCGGCNTMHMDYQTQLNFKEHRTRTTLKKLGHIETTVKPTVGMNNPYYYRNKTFIHFGMRGGRIVAGLHQPQSRDIVNLKRCHVFPKVFSDIIRFIKSNMSDLDIPIYSSRSDKGVFRGVSIRQSRSTEAMTLVLVTKSSKFPHKDALVERLITKYPKIKTIVHHVNTGENPAVLNGKAKVLHGDDVLEDTLMQHRYTMSHKSFFQINPVQTELVYKQALKYANVNNTMTVLDAYTGIGSLALALAPHVGKVIAFDIEKEAIKNARVNAKMNAIENVVFHHGEASQIMPKLSDEAIDVLFVDPPRKGCDQAFLEHVTAMNIARIVYISCNVSTLARDLNYLQAQGYHVEAVTPFDMFPQTSHIESVSLLIKEETSHEND